jgi:sortase A
VRRWLVLALCALGLVFCVLGLRIYVKAAVAQVLLRGAWEQARQGDDRARPWPWADTWAVARLRSARRGVDLIVLAGATGSTTAFGPGHITGTAAPGTIGNVGIAAHRDTHFAFLERVERGEPLWLELPDGRAREFSIDSIAVVHETDTSSLSEAVDGLTLVTCYPFHAANAGGPWRYVVRARAV